METKRIHYLLFRAERHLLTEAERAELDAWYASFKDDNLELDFSEDEREFVRDRLWQKVKGNLDHQPHTAEMSSRTTFSRMKWYFSAASVVLLSLIGYLYYKKSSGSSLEVATLVGEHKNFRLSDGSTIRLGPKSIFSYPREFTGSTREVHLEGEAFFDVFPDHTRPFIVSSGKVKTRVVGTSFLVQTFRNAEALEVTVVSGKVKVYDEKGSFSENVSADQRLSFFNGAALVIDYPEASAESVARQTGSLVYEGKPVEQVLDDLYRYEGVDIEIKGNIASCAYYGTYTIGEGLEDFLAEIAYLVRGKLEKKGDEYVIVAAGCST